MPDAPVLFVLTARKRGQQTLTSLTTEEINEKLGHLPEPEQTTARAVILVTDLLCQQAAFDQSIANSVIEAYQQRIATLERQCDYWRKLGERYLLIRAAFRPIWLDND